MFSDVYSVLWFYMADRITNMIATYQHRLLSMPFVPATSYGRATSVLRTNSSSHSCLVTPTSPYSSSRMWANSFDHGVYHVRLRNDLVRRRV